MHFAVPHAGAENADGVRSAVAHVRCQVAAPHAGGRARRRVQVDG